MAFYRNVLVLMISMALLHVATGGLAVVLPVAMAADQWSGLAIGAVAAAYAGGFMAGAIYAPRFIARVGHIRAFAAAAGVAAGTTLILGLDTQALLWFLARFAFGASTAVMFAVADSWVADVTPANRRGSVFAIYQNAGRAGLVLGPFLLALPGMDLTRGFLLIGVFTAFALVPITATRREQPRAPRPILILPTRLIQIAPAAAASVFVAGMVNSGLLAFVPIWAESLGMSDVVDGSATGVALGAAPLVMAAIYVFAMASQWPAGILSDRIDRRLVIAGLAGAAGAITTLLFIFIDPGLTMGLILIGLWGGTALIHYGVAVAHANDRAEPEDMPGLASSLLLTWAIGSVIGPLVAGAFYASAMGMRGVFLYAAICLFALTGVMFIRSRAKPATPVAEREEFKDIRATSPVLAEVDEDGEYTVGEPE
ncbi:MAG: ABC transporter ATP-binding protein [Maricaulis sp.]|nr:ABC transporter ATP-binding protein [Maricaulis sp.]MAL11436.1 ABC transporter ATP-binding protein [Maricaulis sp.]HAQ34874.1 ABC transporter ATP-binding protein [Alphaproteobacteria bacterium]